MRDDLCEPAQKAKIHLSLKDYISGHSQYHWFTPRSRQQNKFLPTNPTQDDAVRQESSLEVALVRGDRAPCNFGVYSISCHHRRPSWTSGSSSLCFYPITSSKEEIKLVIAWNKSNVPLSGLIYLSLFQNAPSVRMPSSTNMGSHQAFVADYSDWAPGSSLKWMWFLFSLFSCVPFPFRRFLLLQWQSSHRRYLS